ncbi:hypothetical protein SAY86_013028 [Trapa natans]|uniref:Uncharacterized protein n=1 Tax=Trapa natans TaxID=22666 RepID=A0AAN7R7Q7_TRANT|nr:hypothetical protein SAY86_013028 [Trapa natans]
MIRVPQHHFVPLASPGKLPSFFWLLFFPPYSSDCPVAVGFSPSELVRILIWLVVALAELLGGALSTNLVALSTALLNSATWKWERLKPAYESF